jgi:chemotaxis protein CheD
VTTLAAETEAAVGAGPLPETAVYLHPGQVVVSDRPCVVTTVLGSCVAVCLWDEGRSVGGVNHFVLPHGPTGGDGARFGDTATRRLVVELRELGARRLVARIVGGACVLEPFRRGRQHLGARNVAAARSVLASEGIPVLFEDVGGDRGRKLEFHTRDGRAFVNRL